MLPIEESINFNGPEWAAVERWLLSSREKKIGLLLSADNHDASQKIRGAISQIDDMLRLKKAALDLRASR